MVDAPLSHHDQAPAPPSQPRLHGWASATATVAAAVLVVIGLGVVLHAVIEDYRARMTLTGLVDDPQPVTLTVAGEALSVPANMIRSAAARRGGAADRLDLVLHWPSLDGYSERFADDFKEGMPIAAIVYASITRRDIALDATARLDHVYQRFFVGQPLAGPGGLVGRHLDKDSGYGDEIIYFLPDGPRPFVARCPATWSAEVPATCLRDINLGRGLSLIYRFHRDLLGQWRELDTGMRALGAGFLG